ncbi:DUF2510 domain-containing protein [Streptomyces sp. SID4928]|uniref:DUF2510 domain-containing protein n=1 Tax=unclassified Streptomyces TaxID=2593676 RepID=UPI0001C19CB7|nr:DUF2510 domain-containing protein [Streptomyces sp. ACT-1]EGE45532.1 Protein of unknown function DUF2510 [Streptomyces sp. ACT-1]MYR53557.1 DUF2510 domain-containing protein [Streptomyces sp. SID4928]
MSHATPPGWYPDTGAPGLERWWDGTAWTAHTRRPGAAHAAPEQPPAPAAFGPPSLPHQRGPGGGSGGGNRTRILAFTLSGVLVVGAGVAGAVLLGRDEGGTPAAPARATSSPAPVTAPTATASSAGPGPDEDPTVLVDQLNGVTLPVPQGWEKPESTSDDAATIRTEQSYDCPSAAAFCYHGTVTTRTARGGESDVRTLAEADIATAADKAYEEDGLGRRTHGGITSHRVLKAQELTVAGRTGYLVRWKVTTGKGPGGYVQSLVFPSSVGAGTPVIVRFAFDAGAPGLPLSLMDTITRGIRPLGDSATSGGVGASIGP